MSRVLAAALALAMALATAGCYALQTGAGAYKLIVHFPKAPSLYEQSRVIVMGIDIGTVDSVRVEPTRIRVELSVNREVPLPKDVRASVVPLNTLGERNVVLYPPWKKGQARAQNNDVIPTERTDLPVEIDEALKAFTSLTDAINPNQVNSIVSGMAKGLEGRGQEFNSMISKTAGLTSTLAGQDEQLIQVAKNLRTLAHNLNQREAKLKAAITGFSSASAMLAAERKGLEGFIAGLVQLAKSGDVLIQAYTEKLPQGLAALSEIVLTLKANSASIAESIAALAKVGPVVIDAWDRENHLVKVRANLGPTGRYWLNPLLQALGVPKVDCFPAPFEKCVDGPGGGR